MVGLAPLPSPSTGGVVRGWSLDTGGLRHHRPPQMEWSEAGVWTPPGPVTIGVVRGRSLDTARPRYHRPPPVEWSEAGVWTTPGPITIALHRWSGPRPESGHRRAPSPSPSTGGVVRGRSLDNAGLRHHRPPPVEWSEGWSLDNAGPRHHRPPPVEWSEGWSLDTARPRYHRPPPAEWSEAGVWTPAFTAAL